MARRSGLFGWGASLVGLAVYGGIAIADRDDFASEPKRYNSADNIWSLERDKPGSGPFVYYHRCDDARAAEAAPMRRSDPGYREGLDADGDGIACEPYRGSRW